MSWSFRALQRRLNVFVYHCFAIFNPCWIQILCVVVQALPPHLLSYLFLHFYAVDWIENEALGNGNVHSNRLSVGDDDRMQLHQGDINEVPKIYLYPIKARWNDRRALEAGFKSFYE